jgi:hypothetical protein
MPGGVRGGQGKGYEVNEGQGVGYCVRDSA